MHHPGHTGALEGFFAAYGRLPPWPGRHGAMISRCRDMLGLCRDMLGLCQRWLPGGGAALRWRQRIQITSSWTE
jgi:hypothetical protein